MRSRKIVLAAIACSFALIPAGTAAAGSGPAPGPEPKHSEASTAPSAAGNPSSAKAQAAGVCEDAYEIGSPGYVMLDGGKIASVKQFYSPECRENYGYLWVWESFRDKGGDWDVSIGVYSYSQDEILGERTWTNSTGQEDWSNPTDTEEDCTAAVGGVRPSGDPLTPQAASSKRC